MDEKYFYQQLAKIHGSTSLQNDIEILQRIAHDAKVEQAKLDVDIIDANFGDTELRTKDAFINVLKNAALAAVAPKEEK